MWIISANWFKKKISLVILISNQMLKVWSRVFSLLFFSTVFCILVILNYLHLFALQNTVIASKNAIVDANTNTGNKPMQINKNYARWPCWLQTLHQLALPLCNFSLFMWQSPGRRRWIFSYNFSFLALMVRKLEVRPVTWDMTHDIWHVSCKTQRADAHCIKISGS